mgnify:CR=1 FL=1
MAYQFRVQHILFRWIKEKGINRIISFNEIEKVIDHIIAGKLDTVETVTVPHFNLAVPKNIDGVSKDLLHPGADNKIEHAEELGALACQYLDYFKSKYEGKLGSIE